MQQAPAAALGCRLDSPQRQQVRRAAAALLVCPRSTRLLPPLRFVGCRNSEIYNHQQLREAKLAGVDLHSKSDSAVVGYLYQK